MSVNKFKVGDVVKCVDVSNINNLTLGKEYIVIHSHIGDVLLYLYDDNGDEACYNSYRFELSNDSANTSQPSKFKEGDMLNGNKISNVTIPCLITGLCKMVVVSVVMIIICLLMAKVGE